MLGLVLAPINAALTHLCFLCATVTALRGVRGRCSNKSSNVAPVDTATLKLWLMLSGLAALSTFGLDYVPLLPEMRVLFMALLLLTTPSVHAEVYDRAFAPLLARAGAAVASAQSSVYVVRFVSLLALRACVCASMAIMKHVQYSGVVDDDVVHDIFAGLAFTRRALDDADERIARATAAAAAVSSSSLLRHAPLLDDHSNDDAQQRQQQLLLPSSPPRAHGSELDATTRRAGGRRAHSRHGGAADAGLLDIAGDVQTAVLRHLDSWLRGGRRAPRPTSPPLPTPQPQQQRGSDAGVLSASELQVPATSDGAVLSRRRGAGKMFSS